MLTKSLLCISAALTGMPYILESSEFQELFYLTWKALIWQVSVSSAQERQFSGVRKILCCLQLSKSQFPTYIPNGLEEASGRPSVFEECPNTSTNTNHRELMFALMSRQPSERHLLRAPVCTSVWMANWRLRTVNIANNHPDTWVIPSKLDD